MSGPMKRAVLNTIEFMAMEVIRCFFGTRLGAKATRDAELSPDAIPTHNVSKSSSQMFIKPASINKNYMPLATMAID